MAVNRRVFLRRECADPELVERFRGLPTANVCDCMERLGVMDGDIRLLSNPSVKHMAGVALTVRTIAGDNMMLHAAMELAGPGDVIVVDNEGGRKRSLAGANMFGHMIYKGVTGLVMDGPIRDLDAASEMDWYIFATGTTSRGPYKDGPGEVNVPVCCGGVTVHPGDIILGDMDGVLVIPRQDAQAVLEAAIPYAQADAVKAKNALLGLSRREWVPERLAAQKVEYLDQVYR